MKVFLYERVSSEEQAKHGYSLDAQHEALILFCEKHDHVIVGEYRDEGISARKPYTKRPAMLELLRDVETIKPDMILFTKLDRWFRNIKEYYKVQDILDKNKVDWKAINEEYDTSTASGRLYVNIKLSIAQDEADRTSERIKDVQQQLISQGRVLCGSVPVGYKIENKKVVFGEDIEIVKKIIEHYKTYQSINKTVHYINDLTGRVFNHPQLVALLKNPLLKGEYRGNPNFCEPLLTPEEFEELQAILSRNIKFQKKREYMFTGMLICPCCGSKMGGMFDTRKRYYRCNWRYMAKCDMKHSIGEVAVEKWLLENIEEDFKVNVTMKPTEKVENPQKYRDRLKRLNDMYFLGNIDEEEYKEKTASLQKKIAELSRVTPPKETKFESGWKELYEMLDYEHKRAFWRNLIKGIEVDMNARPVRILY